MILGTSQMKRKQAEFYKFFSPVLLFVTLLILDWTFSTFDKVNLSEEMRKKVIDLYSQGKGNKAISTALRLHWTASRVIIHNWAKSKAL